MLMGLLLGVLLNTARTWGRGGAAGAGAGDAQSDGMSRFLRSPAAARGRHLSPGHLARRGSLTERSHEVTLLISRKKVDARLIEKYPHLRFARMPGRPFSWGPLKLLRCVLSQVQAVLFCLGLMARWRPDVMVGFGGRFTSAALVLAGRLGRVPVALHECNRVPGLAIRALGRFADRVYLPCGIRLGSVGAAATRQVGLPVRREIVRHGRTDCARSLGSRAESEAARRPGREPGRGGAQRLDAHPSRSLGRGGRPESTCLTGLGKGEAETIETEGQVRSHGALDFRALLQTAWRN